MRLVYVAGPYRSKYGFIGRLINICKARKVAKELWKMGYAALCPHSNTAFFDGVCHDKNFLGGDIEMLKHCDAVIALPKWSRSKGTREEIKFADKNNIPIILLQKYNGEIRLDKEFIDKSIEYNRRKLASTT